MNTSIKKKEIGFTESKKILFSMLQSIDAFCRANDIKYSLTYGTLLGAARHKGFIPWDDDIDVMMTRSNYDKFVTTFKDDRYELLTLQKGSDWWPCFSRLSRKGTEVYFQGAIHAQHGLWIAFIPVDNIPGDYMEWDKVRYKLKHYIDLVSLKRKSLSQGRNQIKNLVKLPLRLILSPLSVYYVGCKAERLKCKYNTSPTNKVSQWVEGARHIVFPAYYMEEYTELEFEGQMFMCIKEYDAYLKGVYGNYLQLPPVEQQVPLHNYKMYYSE